MPENEGARVRGATENGSMGVQRAQTVGIRVRGWVIEELLGWHHQGRAGLTQRMCDSYHM